MPPKPPAPHFQALARRRARGESPRPRRKQAFDGQALSKSDQGVACFDLSCPISLLKSVGFDFVKEDWYGKRFFHQVRSCDALYKHGDLYYLIEFKTGNATNVDRHRKLYDSVIALVENSVLTFEECRSQVQYIIVEKGLKPFVQHQEMLSHFERNDPEPWDYAVTKSFLKTISRDDIRKLSGFLVEKVYRLSPLDFEKFVENRNWSN